MHQNPRFYTLSATAFDGTTRPPGAPSPAPWLGGARAPATANEPRQYMVVTEVGRLAFPDLNRSRKTGALVSVRCLWDPAIGDVLQQRSVKSSDWVTGQADDPLPLTEDALLRQDQLSKVWSPFRLYSPTDALALVGTPPTQPPATGGTVEILVIDLTADEALAWAAKCCDDQVVPLDEIQIFNISDSDPVELPVPNAEQVYYNFVGSTSRVFVLPPSAQWLSTDIVVHFQNAVVGTTQGVRATTGEKINGRTAATDAQLQVRIGQGAWARKFLDAEFAATWEDGDPNRVTLASDGTTSVGSFRGHLDVQCFYSAGPGEIALPNPALVAVGDTLTFTRVTSGGSDGNVVRIHTSDPVNGVVGDIATEWYLRAVGDSVTFRRYDGAAGSPAPGWRVDQGTGARPALVSAVNITGAQLRGREGVMLADVNSPAISAQLPLLAEVRPGYMIGFFNPNFYAVSLTAQGADLVDGVASVQVPAQGHTLAIASSSGWKAHGARRDPPAISTAVAIVLSPWTGVQYITVTGAGNFAITMPAIGGSGTLYKGASRAVVVNRSTGSVTMTPVAGEFFNLNAATYVVPSNFVGDIECNGTYWVGR